MVQGADIGGAGHGGVGRAASHESHSWDPSGFRVQGVRERERERERDREKERERKKDVYGERERGGGEGCEDASWFETLPAMKLPVRWDFSYFRVQGSAISG